MKKKNNQNIIMVRHKIILDKKEKKYLIRKGTLFDKVIKTSNDDLIQCWNQKVPIMQLKRFSSLLRIKLQMSKI